MQRGSSSLAPPTPPDRFVLFFCSKQLTELDVVAALWETDGTLLNTNFNTLGGFCNGSVVLLQTYQLWGNKG